MINLKQIINESKYDYGCIMARIDMKSSKSILEFNYDTINENMLYCEGNRFGREQTPHITVKYGLTESYTEEQIKQIIHKTTPFDIRIRGISLFENDNFDVVKFDIESPMLHKLNEIFSKLPNHDSHPIYHPHMTLAYVHKGMGKQFIKSPKKSARLKVSTLEYLDRGDKRTFFNL